MKKILITLFLLSWFGYLAISQTHQKEKFYQNIFADSINGKTEVVLSDGARADIVTDTFAIEVDFAYKWAESIGQSLYYSEMLGKKAGVLLISRTEKDNKYIERLMVIAMKFNITIWIIDIEKLTIHQINRNSK